MKLSQIRPVWAEIDLDVFRRNIATIKAHLRPETSIMAVVKADAYGHGAVEASRAAIEAGAQALAVAILAEAEELRTAGLRCPIVVLGYTPEEQADRVIEADVAQAVWTPEAIAALGAAARKRRKVARIHIKIDTGMGRIGVRPGPELERVINGLRSAGGISVEGAFTHFAAADDDAEYTRFQFELFAKGVEQLRAAGIQPRYLHACNSAGTVACREYHLDYVRPGIAIYGYPHRPVEGLGWPLSWKAKVAYVKEIEAGETVGYGRAFTAMERTRVATIPVGYADGYHRSLSNKGEVLIRGARAKVIGRVCMDQLMVDVTRIPGVRAGDVAVLVGKCGDRSIGADELGGLAGTIAYEILTSISRRVPRVYIDRGRCYTVASDGSRVEIERD